MFSQLLFGISFVFLIGSCLIYFLDENLSDQQTKKITINSINTIQDIKVASDLYKLETNSNPESLNSLITIGFLKNNILNTLSSNSQKVTLTEDYYEGSQIVSFYQSDLINENICNELNQILEPYNNIVLSICDTEITQFKFIDPDDIYQSLN
jgi:competence protein ComGC